MKYSVIIFCISILFTNLQGCVEKKADLVIFSYDRPLQLYALIESLNKYVTGINSIAIVYRASSNAYDAAFKNVASSFPYVQFFKQESIDDFKTLTVQALDSGLSDYILFAVDDNIVKDYVDLSECIEWLENTKSYGFYLKLGTHLTHCYTENCTQEVPHYSIVHDDIYAWNFEDGQKDWNYPNTVDMTLYRKKDLLNLFKQFVYTNPNFLEAQWASWWVQHKNNARIGIFYKNSKILNIPINRVQNDMLNRDMNLYTPQELLEKFEAGLKIDILPFYQIKNNAVHMEYEPIFIQRI